MSTLVVVGVQWGDEGKGKVVHLLGHQADMVVRYQGGNMVDLTVFLKKKFFFLFLFPSYILEPVINFLIVLGVVVDPFGLNEKLNFLEELKKRVTVLLH